MDDWQRTHVGLILPICRALELRDFDRLALAGDRLLLDQMIRAIQETFRALEKQGFYVIPRHLRMLLLPTFILRPLFSLFLRTSTAEVAIVQHAARAGEEMTRLERDLLAVLGDSPLPYLQKLLSRR
jgi:2-dehydropantoate 2-reductase